MKSWARPSANNRGCLGQGWDGCGGTPGKAKEGPAWPRADASVPWPFGRPFPTLDFPSKEGPDSSYEGSARDAQPLPSTSSPGSSPVARRAPQHAWFHLLDPARRPLPLKPASYLEREWRPPSRMGWWSGCCSRWRNAGYPGCSSGAPGSGHGSAPWPAHWLLETHPPRAAVKGKQCQGPGTGGRWAGQKEREREKQQPKPSAPSRTPVLRPAGL